ncbi:ligand-dependent nuclear receptor-interacting factor 1-like isoform X2 [Myxocyprinus asiaticus]|uniref:ligand-dependent nuclear receptor-interacting factor 1-like isoform X2 n=1 Tax=Myxocyprinus asiaticus TaxID=70543 RepID=UPI002222D794|nr:ligand-dependent nuclear receptor-interacting factor 1-like isoform X2 [Myxocyprinus asiaticus]
MEGGTGVYYQAMPAVGPDGKNVMKLIPVHKVNGQFFQTPFIAERDNVDIQLKVLTKPVHPSPAPSSQPQTRLPSVQPIADGRYVLTPPEVSTLFNSKKVQNSGTNELSKLAPKQVLVPLAVHTVSQCAVQLPPQTNGQTMAVVQKLPVTVKSPVLPNGHCLQIPPNAKVRTLPASALPPSIKSRIMKSVNNISNNEKSPPTVVLVSPVNSVKINSDQQVLLANPSQIQKALSQNQPANFGTNPTVCSPSNKKPSENVNTPIKWVVQEGTGAFAPCLVPVSSTHVNSDSIGVKHVESVTTTSEYLASKATPAQISQEKINPGKDNALVMCNGKVYFVAKKNSEIARDVMVSEGGKKGFISTSPALPSSSALALESSKVTKEQNLKINVNSGTPSEIIDLCDDDEESSTCLGGSPGNLPTPSQTEVDESDEDSNVIFVSYIPPKSETHAGEKETNSASWNKRIEMAHTEMEMSAKSTSQNEREEMAHAGIEISEKSASQNEREETAHTKIEICKKSGSLRERVETAHAEMEKDGDQENPAAMDGDDKMGVDEKAKESEMAEKNLSFLSENEDMEDKELESSLVNPAPDQESQHKSDLKLRQEFGIISDIQICMQRINTTAKPDLQPEKLVVNKLTLDGLRKLIQESQLQSKIQQMIQEPQTKIEEDRGMNEVERKKLEQNGKGAHQDVPSLSTTNISFDSKCKGKKSQNVSVSSIENSLVSQTFQDEVCSSSQNSGEVAESTANKVQMQYEIPGDITCNTHCVTLSSEQAVTQTTSQTLSPSSATRKTPPRAKRGKVCTACPCGTVLGTAEATSSLQPQERPNPHTVVESHKEARNCLNKTPVESCQSDTPQPTRECDPVKKAGKKRLSSSPQNDKSLSKKCIKETSHAISEMSEQDISHTRITSNETSMRSNPWKQQGPKVNELSTQDLYSVEVLDAEEIKRRERIKRLKDLLKEKEAALERMQRSMDF